MLKIGTSSISSRNKEVQNKQKKTFKKIDVYIPKHVVPHDRPEVGVVVVHMAQNAGQVVQQHQIPVLIATGTAHAQVPNLFNNHCTLATKILLLNNLVS